MPETSPPTSSSALPEITAASQGQHAHILLVTADRKNGEVLRTRLALAGFGVTWATGIAPALAAVQVQMPDLALLDPCDEEELDGEALSSQVSALKSAAEDTYLPVVLLTGQNASAEQHWAASGADDIMPFSTDKARLHLRLEALLHLKRRHQAMADSILEMEATCRAAQQAAARYEAVFQQSMQAMLVVDDSGMIVEANACAYSLIGCEPETLSGLPLAVLCPPELSWASDLAKQGPLRPFIDPAASLVTASEALIPVAVSSAPIAPAFSRQCVVTLTDRRPELSQVYAAQRAAAQETAASFSREINNPLFVVSSNVEMLQSTLSHEESGVQAKLGRIADAGQRIVQAAARASAPPAEN